VQGDAWRGATQMVRTVRLPAFPSRTVAVVPAGMATTPRRAPVGGRLQSPRPVASVTLSAEPDRNALAEVRFGSQPINVDTIMSHKTITSPVASSSSGGRPKAGDWPVTHL